MQKIVFLSFSSFRMEDDVDNNIMNDDCMNHVFKNFNPRDLIRLAQVSLQFQRVAQQTFRRKYKRIHLNKHFSQLNSKTLRLIFENFGHLIEEFSTTSNFYPWFSSSLQKMTISMIVKNCAQKENPLRSLELRFFTNIGHKLVDMNEIFEHLEVLKLDHVAIPYSIRSLLHRLPNAKEISLFYCIPSKHTFKHNEITINHKLQKLHLKCRQELQIANVLVDIDIAFPNIHDLKFKILG